MSAPAHASPRLARAGGRLQCGPDQDLPNDLLPRRSRLDTSTITVIAAGDALGTPPAMYRLIDCARGDGNAMPP